MKKTTFLFLASIVIMLQSCGGGGKTIGEVRAENATFVTELNNKLIKAKEMINAHPVDSNATCDFKEKLVFIRDANDCNADYLLEDEINDWTSSIGEGFASTGRQFSLSQVKFAMTELLEASNPEKDAREDSDGDLQKKVDHLKKVRYYVILNKPAQTDVPDSLVKADFYLFDTEKSDFVCQFATYTPSHTGTAAYEEVLMEGNKQVSNRGVVENFQTKQGDDIKAALKDYLVKNLKATVK